MFQIEEVVTQAAEHLLDGIGIAVVERGVRRDARTNLKQITVAGITFHDLLDVELALGTGADKGHLTTEHVPQLG